MHHVHCISTARLLSLHHLGSQGCYRLIEDHYAQRIPVSPSHRPAQQAEDLQCLPESLLLCYNPMTSMSSSHPPHYLLLHVRGLGAPQGLDKRPGSGVAGPPWGRGWLGLPDSGVSISAESKYCFQQSYIDLPHSRSPYKMIYIKKIKFFKKSLLKAMLDVQIQSTAGHVSELPNSY